MITCPKCGNYDYRESRQCPQFDGHPVCIRCCYECSYYDAETYHCLYHLSHPRVDYDREICLVEQQIISAERKVRRLYEKNWPGKAEKLERDVALLLRKRRELERKRNENAKKTCTAL